MTRITTGRVAILLSAALGVSALQGCSGGTTAPDAAESATQRKAKADAIKGMGVEKPSRPSKGAAGKAKGGSMPGDDI
ncbi:hypothetical protein OJF2_32320 [Aquisphaera giovannonii]|uniref:Lipoprotein n=1 Tax=Aquisphaera giovannonii TaxID=406548 RepID=A0A5B9W3L1_9BACT|nr:hypothetical protein [Aquisphaera giovannonii]QEH34691.1 hypothetical protein OJF2_32320 [Aquisphaera giovannonii]